MHLVWFLITRSNEFAEGQTKRPLVWSHQFDLNGGKEIGPSVCVAAS